MYNDVDLFIKSCEQCQQSSNAKYTKNAHLIPIITNKPLEIITSDIMGPIKTSKIGNKYILCIVDHFTKWVDIHAKPEGEALTVAKKLMLFIAKHGIPDAILTDQGRNYQSKLIAELWDMLDVHKLRTTPFHPQCDGLTERFNRTLKRMITCFINKQHDNWDELLPMLSLAYNTSVHTTTK